MGKPRISPDAVSVSRNVSLPAPMADQLDALNPHNGNRSMFFRELIELGAATKYGKHWQTMANSMLELIRTQTEQAA